MPRKRKYKYPICIITWNDAVCHGGDREGEPKHQPDVQISLGWLLKEDEIGITYCSEYSEDGSYRDENFIPAGMVVKMEYKK